MSCIQRQKLYQSFNFFESLFSCSLKQSQSKALEMHLVYQHSCEVHDFVRGHVYCLSLGLFPSICFIKMCVWWNKSWEILINNSSPAVHLVEEGLKNYWISSTQLKQCSGVLSKTKRRRVCFRGVSQLPNHICDNMHKNIPLLKCYICCSRKLRPTRWIFKTLLTW